MTTPLQKAARELMLRWDSPYWKDQPGTAHFMGELRKALDAAPPQVLEPGPTTRPLTPEEAEMMQSLGVTGKCVRVLAFNDRPPTGDRASLIRRADASVTALNSRIMEPFYCGLDQEAIRVLMDCVDMLEADAVLAVSKRDYSTQQMRDYAEARIQADRAARRAEQGPCGWMKNIDKAMQEPLFQALRGMMGTENIGQDMALLQTIRHFRAKMPHPVPASFQDEVVRLAATELYDFQEATRCDTAAQFEAQQVAVSAWTDTATRMPGPCVNVLAYTKQPIRAQWVPAKTLEVTREDDYSGEYDEATDRWCWPEGWYETNEYAEAQGLIDEPVTHWMPLLAPPKGAVPLTDNEILNLQYLDGGFDLIKFARSIEAHHGVRLPLVTKPDSLPKTDWSAA